MITIKTMTIELKTVDKVRSFAAAIGEIDGEFDLVLGRYVVDAKSVMGIFSLDISKPLELRILDDKLYDETLLKLGEFAAAE